MKQVLTVTTKGDVYWSVEVTDSEPVHRDGESTIFRRMHERAERLRKVVQDPNDHANDEERKPGEIIR